jgi:hypothetical protein
MKRQYIVRLAVVSSQIVVAESAEEAEALAELHPDSYQLCDATVTAEKYEG